MTVLQLIKLLLGLSIAAAAAGVWLRWPDRRKHFALALLASGFATLIAEILLQQFFPQYDGHNDLFEPDPELGWRFIPGQVTSVAWAREASHYVSVNRSGFRDAPFSRSADRTKTILCFGDSFVSNLAVQDEQVFTRLMERELSTTSVLNLGVNGFGQTQELLLMEQQLGRHEADLVIVVLYLRNDFTDNVNSSWIYPRPIIAEAEHPRAKFAIVSPDIAQRPEEPLWHSLTRSHVLSLANHTINDLVHRWEAGANGFRPTETTPPELYLCAKESWDGTAHLQDAMEFLLLEIQTLCRRQAVPLLFVIAPTLYQVSDQKWAALLDYFGENPLDYDRSLPNAKLLQFASNHGIRMLDLLPKLQNSPLAQSSLYHNREQHWNPAGNALVAEILTRFLKSEGWPSIPPDFSIAPQSVEID